MEEYPDSNQTWQHLLVVGGPTVADTKQLYGEFEVDVMSTCTIDAILVTYRDHH